MFKSFAALVMVALLGACVVALPALAPKVEASEATALAKADRLEVGTPRAECAAQVWPNLTAPCLRTANGGGQILEARLVTARR
jgi:hypothetical protein